MPFSAICNTTTTQFIQAGKLTGFTNNNRGSLMLTRKQINAITTMILFAREYFSDAGSCKTEEEFEEHYGDDYRAFDGASEILGELQLTSNKRLAAAQ